MLNEGREGVEGNKGDKRVQKVFENDVKTGLRVGCVRCSHSVFQRSSCFDFLFDKNFGVVFRRVKERNETSGGEA